MSLTFLNPLLLFGLAAAILPILIHRITQRKVVVRRFSAVHLLLQSQRITAKPQRLKHLLLLILRILAVATIVFMMARPVLVRPGFATLPEDGATVLILDNTLSMGFGEDRGRRYDMAKKAAAEALNDFQGRVTLIPTASVRSSQKGSWMKPKEVLRTMDTLPLSFSRGDTVFAFKSAYRQLKQLKLLPTKQILVISDMAQSDWQHLDLTALKTIPDAAVTFFRIGGPGRDANFRIKAVFLTDRDMIAGVSNRLAVIVSNLSDQNATPLVQVRLSGITVHQKTIDLEPGQDKTVFFDLIADSAGWIDGDVTSSPDRLPADDRFYFSLNVKEKVKVLIVDGAPKPSLKSGESYFLDSALRPGGLQKSPFLTRVITEQELTLQNPESYDVLFLLNVARPDLSLVTSVLDMGKPVFLFLGDRIVPEAYNRFSIAPWKILERIDRGDGAEKINLVGSIPEALKILRPLKNSLPGASFHTYFKLGGSGEKLLALNSGDPLLIASDAGNSRLFLFASSADLDWNDLPLTAAYLPFVQGLVKQAAGLSGTSLPPGIEIGAAFGQNDRAMQLTGLPGGPGIYQIHDSTGELRRGVNPPHAESDLIKITEDELKKKFGATDVNVLEYQEAGLKALHGGKQSLWPPLLILLMAVLALEMILANGMGITGFKR